MQPQDPSDQPAALPDAMLLATTGGLLDAVVYLNHGHVIANAMTGNVIFLGIAVLGHDWADIFPHLVPLAGFFAGILTSKHLRARMGIRSALLGLGLEIVVIFPLAWLPRSFPEMAFTAIIAYVAPFQVASFRRVDRFAYNSTSSPEICAMSPKASTTLSPPPPCPRRAKKVVPRPALWASSPSASLPEPSSAPGPPPASATTPSGSPSPFSSPSPYSRSAAPQRLLRRPPPKNRTCRCIIRGRHPDRSAAEWRDLLLVWISRCHVSP